MKWGVTEFKHRTLDHGHYAIGHQMFRRGFDMASHLDHGFCSCVCFGEFRDWLGLLCSCADMPECNGFFNWKIKNRWFHDGICDVEKNITNKYNIWMMAAID